MLPTEPMALDQAAGALARRIAADLAADGIPPERRTIRYELDLRFMRQQWELTMTADEGFTAEAQQAIVERFTAEYARRYGKGALMMGAPVEVVALRVIGTGATTRPELTVHPRSEAAVQAAGTRTIHLDDGGGLAAREVPCYDGATFAAGQVISGPALIDAPDTTIWVPPGCIARTDAHLTLDIEVTA